MRERERERERDRSAVSCTEDTDFTLSGPTFIEADEEASVVRQRTLSPRSLVAPPANGVRWGEVQRKCKESCF